MGIGETKGHKILVKFNDFAETLICIVAIWYAKRDIFILKHLYTHPYTHPDTLTSI